MFLLPTHQRIEIIEIEIIEIMKTTNVTMYVNMGFLDTDTNVERRLSDAEVQTNIEDLQNHIRDLLPEPDVLGLEDEICQIVFNTLETCCNTDDSTSYNMKFTVSVEHENNLSLETMSQVINGIYDNGASFPITLDEHPTPNCFLYPFKSTVSEPE